MDGDVMIDEQNVQKKRISRREENRRKEKHDGHSLIQKGNLALTLHL